MIWLFLRNNWQSVAIAIIVGLVSYKIYSIVDERDQALATIENMRLEALKQSERVKILTEQGKQATASLQASHIADIKHIGALYGKELQNDKKTIANYRTELANKLREQSESSDRRMSKDDTDRPAGKDSDGVLVTESKDCAAEKDYIRTLEEAGAVCSADYNTCYGYVKQEQNRIGVSD